MGIFDEAVEFIGGLCSRFANEFFNFNVCSFYCLDLSKL